MQMLFVSLCILNIKKEYLNILCVKVQSKRSWHYRDFYQSELTGTVIVIWTGALLVHMTLKINGSGPPCRLKENE